MAEPNGGNDVKVNRNTLAIVVTIAVASMAWGGGLYKQHEDRIRALEILTAQMSANARLLERTEQKVDLIGEDVSTLKSDVKELKRLR